MARIGISPAQTIREWLKQADRLSDGNLSVWHSKIADTVVRFSSTDAATASRYRSRIAGDEIKGCRPRLRFHLIETEHVGWPAPGKSEIWRNCPHWLNEHFASEGLAALMPERRREDEGYPWIFFDPSTGCGLMLVRSVADVPPWAVGSPFSLLFHLAYAWRGWRFLHAATLGLEESGGLLLVGSGGAGKSASTLAGIRHGLKTVGDDYVMLQPDPDPVAWPVYRCVKQSPAGLSRFPGLGTALADEEHNWHGKIEFDPEPLFPGCWASSLRLTAIVVPKISDVAATIFSAIPPTAAFSTLAASLFPQLPGARLAGFALLTRLTRALPAFEARLSSDADEIGAAFYRFVRQGPA